MPTSAGPWLLRESCKAVVKIPLQVVYIPGQSGRLRRGYELITAAVNRNDVTGFLGVVFQLLAQLRNMHVDGPGIGYRLIPPDFVQQLFPRDGRLAVSDQVAQELE